jgi:hypothetical protein
MLPTMLTLWGLVSTLQGVYQFMCSYRWSSGLVGSQPMLLGVVRSYSGLLACRFFLGLFEGMSA